MQINQVLKDKSSDAVITITPQASVRELVALLVDNNIGALIVSSDDASVDGIVSERDVVRRLHADASVLDAPVESIMTSTVYTCEPTGSVDDLMSLMTQHRIRHVPVVAEERLVGVISIGDVVKSRMAELKFERDQLDSYMHQT